MTEQNNVGCKQLLVWRMFMAIASSIVAQFFFMSCVILIVNLSVTHPLSWIHNSWVAVTCFRTWSYFLILATVIFLQGIICSKNYLNAPPYLKSRFAVACNMLTAHNFLLGSLHILVGGVSVWLHLSLEGGRYDSLTSDCETTHGSCLVEEHLFLLLSGLFTGFYFFTKANFFSLDHLEFPIIPQSKFSRIKQGIGSILPIAMLSAVWPTLYFTIFYYAFGGYFRRMALSVIATQTDDKTLDSFYGLMNLSLIFHSWLFSLLFVLTMNTMHLMFQAHLTERVKFEIGQTGVFKNESSGVTLAEALATDKIPIMQHLGYLDLVILAQKEKARRSVLFTLSQPGGHPYNWNCIAEKYFALVTGFTSDLDTACPTSLVNVPVPNATALAAQSMQLPERSYRYNMRNLTAAKISSQNSLDSTNSKQNPPGEQFLFQLYQKKRDRFVAYLLSKPLIHYMFGEQSDFKIRHILIKGQPVIWAADAISTLAAASLEDDPYGIVQKDLAAIIDSLLALKLALDKLHRANAFIKRPQSDDKPMRQMVACLRSATKRSIYRITTTFKNYLNDLALEPATMDQLQGFLSYRE